MGWCSQMASSSLSRVSNFSPDMDVNCLWVLPLLSLGGELRKANRLTPWENRFQTIHDRQAMELFKPNRKFLFHGHDFPLGAFAVNSQCHLRTPRFSFSHFTPLTTLGLPNSKHGPIPFIFNSFKKTLSKVRKTGRERKIRILLLTLPHPLPNLMRVRAHTSTHKHTQAYKYTCLLSSSTKGKSQNQKKGVLVIFHSFYFFMKFLKS